MHESVSVSKQGSRDSHASKMAWSVKGSRPQIVQKIFLVNECDGFMKRKLQSQKGNCIVHSYNDVSIKEREGKKQKLETE